MSGMPIDVLFRLGVQSINAYSNAVALTQTGGAGSPEFFQLLYDLRLLQVAGLLNIRLAHTHPVETPESTAPIPPAAAPTPVARPSSPAAAASGAAASAATASAAAASAVAAASAAVAAVAAPPARPPAAQSNGFHGVSGLPPYVYLTFTPTPDPDLTKVEDEAKRLMNVPPHAAEAEVIYGRSAGPGQVAMITRSVLGVMSQLAIQIEVPPQDVARHRTLPTVGNVGPERRPVVIIHCARTKPDNTFTSVRYGENTFWIDNDDFDSKLAFTVLQVLLALARSGSVPGALVSVPAH
jgi:hypothetical protein